jgi:hypothetical protein
MGGLHELYGRGVEGGGSLDITWNSYWLIGSVWHSNGRRSPHQIESELSLVPHPTVMTSHQIRLPFILDPSTGELRHRHSLRYGRMPSSVQVRLIDF